MLPITQISQKGKKKIQLYAAADYLFNKGKSHPQIMDILKVHEPDADLLEQIVDKAMREEWDKLLKKAMLLFAEGKIYADVLAVISEKESDPEIAYWICNEWYKYKTFYAECMIEESTNRFEGAKWMVLSAMGVIVMFSIGATIVSRII